MSRKTAVISIIAALIVGVIIGSAGGDEPEPVVETVTETVVETETVEVEVPVEVPVEVERTPQACLDALDAARALFRTAGETMVAASDYPVMVADAMEAGMAMDVRAAEGILTRMDAVQAVLAEAEAVIEASDFPTLARACERGAV